MFDYTLTDQGLFVALLDARGHGLRAATVAAVATSAMRPLPLGMVIKGLLIADRAPPG